MEITVPSLSLILFTVEMLWAQILGLCTMELKLLMQILSLLTMEMLWWTQILDLYTTELNPDLRLHPNLWLPLRRLQNLGLPMADVWA